ncbi:MAG TPA: hypothetical protein PKY31_04080 [Spirochaetota bacterium]|nr:hypothetical protein [Spirochaetota bacterium]
MKDDKDTHGVDMSPAAIEKRLRKVSELYRLYQKIKTARKIGPVVNEPDTRES